MTWEEPPARRRLRRAVEAARARDAPAETGAQPRIPAPFGWQVPSQVESGVELIDALRFLLRLGELLLQCGAGSVDVEASTRACANALGLPRMEVSITSTEIVITVGERGAAPITDMRIVRARAPDHSRLVAAHQLVLDLTEGRLDAPEAFARLDEIRHARKRYSRWFVTVGWAVLAGAVAVQLGGGVVITAVTFVSTILIDRLGRRLARRNLPAFFLNVIGGAVATAVAVVLHFVATAMPTLHVSADTSLIIAGGIFLLLPGLTTLSAVQDALTGYLVTSAARAIEVLILSAGIVAGIAIVLALGVRFGVHLEVHPPTQIAYVDYPVRIVAAGFVSAGLCIGYYSPARLIPASAAIGALGYGSFLALDQYLSERAISRAGAALVVGLLCRLYAQRRRTPALALVVPAIVPLTPGLTVYSAMVQLTQQHGLGGVETLLSAVTQALAIAAGVILGQFLAQPVRRELNRFDRRFAGPRFAGPRDVSVPRRLSPRRSRRSEHP